MAITHINSWNAGAAGSLTVSPATIGNVLVATVANTTNNTLTSMSGGGVTTWNVVGSWFSSTANNTICFAWGVVTATGSASASYTLNGGSVVISQIDEFHSSSPGWAFDTSNANFTSGSGGTMNSSLSTPSLAATELGVAAWISENGGAAGAGTSGWNYNNIHSSGEYLFAYNLGVTNSTGAPHGTQNNAGSQSLSVTMLLANPSGNICMII